MMPRGSGTRWPPSPLDRRSGHSPAPAQLGRPISLRHRHLATSPPRQAQVLVHSVPGPSSRTWLEEQNWADWSHLLIGCKHKWYHLERYPLPAPLVPALSFRSQGPASLLSPPAFLVLPTSHLNTYPSPPAARKDPQVPDPRSGSYPLPQSGTLLPQITPLLPPGTCINAKQGVVPPALRTGIRHNPANPGSLRFPTTGQSQPPRPHPACRPGGAVWLVSPVECEWKPRVSLPGEAVTMRVDSPLPLRLAEPGGGETRVPRHCLEDGNPRSRLHATEN